MQNNQSGTVTMLVDNLLPVVLDFYSAEGNCGTMFSFNLGAPAAQHNTTLIFMGASPSAPFVQTNPEFHIAEISCVHLSQLPVNLYTEVATVQVLDL